MFTGEYFVKAKDRNNSKYTLVEGKVNMIMIHPYIVFVDNRSVK